MAKFSFWNETSDKIPAPGGSLSFKVCQQMTRTNIPLCDYLNLNGLSLEVRMDDLVRQLMFTLKNSYLESQVRHEVKKTISVPQFVTHYRYIPETIWDAIKERASNWLCRFQDWMIYVRYEAEWIYGPVSDFEDWLVNRLRIRFKKEVITELLEVKYKNVDVIESITNICPHHFSSHLDDHVFFLGSRTTKVDDLNRLIAASSALEFFSKSLDGGAAFLYDNAGIQALMGLKGELKRILHQCGIHSY